MNNNNYVHTREKGCVGCNKCIFVCPVDANEALLEGDENRVFIKNGFCISCGECIAICDHDARDYYDHLDEFLAALNAGEKLSVVIAPAAKFNFQDTGRLIGFLKSLGVDKVYDVSFGADICTWGHVKALKEKRVDHIIAQPCPVIVSFIEKYHPELISSLSPVQSPVICQSIYLKRYLKEENKIAFLSPCIGKSRECKSNERDFGLDYNITFAKFAKYMEKQGIDLSSYPMAEFDNVEGSLGFAFPRPGGLSENIRYHLDEDIWIKQIEGIKNIEHYFKEYIEDKNNGNPIPTIVDALNCEHGCNIGTGSMKTARINVVDYVLNQRKANLSKSKSQELMTQFSETLELSDFLRTYSDRSVTYQIDESIDLENTFIELGKVTRRDRETNCFSCGYGNCTQFAYAMATGHNHKNNCKYYLLNKFKRMSLIDDLTGVKNRNSYNAVVDELEREHPDFVGIIFVDINGLKTANDVFGHSFGDAMIIKCAEILRDIFKGKVYRVGGDEFVILEDESTEPAFDKNVSDLRLKIRKDKGLVASIGCAKSYDKEEILDSIQLADTLMYQEKEKYYKKKTKASRRSR